MIASLFTYEEAKGQQGAPLFLVPPLNLRPPHPRAFLPSSLPPTLTLTLCTPAPRAFLPDVPPPMSLPPLTVSTRITFCNSFRFLFHSTT